MRSTLRSKGFDHLLSLILLMGAFTTTAPGASATETSYAFNSTDGNGYRAGLRIDANGNIWGTSLFGGTYGYGNVFELSHDANGQWTETVLYNFTNGPDGGNPADDSGLTVDSGGNLYGTTTSGGAYDGGTVFRLARSSAGWQETVLYNFTCGDDGCSPEAGVVFDTAGNLYGTTWGGGPGGSGYGTVYKLSLQPNGRWKETTLHFFTGASDGAGPYSPVILDAAGNVYGTTSAGGLSSCKYGPFYGCGVIFELTPIAGGWTEHVLYHFAGLSDGASPGGQLTFDSSGNLYGTAGAAGDPLCRCGTVFRLGVHASNGGSWSFSPLHRFTGNSDGAYPVEGVLLDHSGTVYGTATYGGEAQGACLEGGAPEACGTVFALSPSESGAWNFELLYSFSGNGDGGTPFDISFGPDAKIYGAAGEGGYFGGNCFYSGGCGVVFELTSH